ncbi:hypothetical protein LOTGIDRAFT_174742 [Lottia gigantea]|uniref:PDZ domain-containing protein n=1 Tax=Lottia gigantea TaxID=225164 RepID=V4C533_LOTGI|nr:hypothetical protein LOTGIDRAFT_174742 [Lottia gigantea]ESO96699.1 hypothetical protein LOTGIDRAFT_174742 [Lottia gigantea]
MCLLTCQFRLNAIYVSRITENGAAHHQGKLLVGDRIISINGVDVTDARHDQAVVLLSGSEPKVELVVYREMMVPKSDTVPTDSKLTPTTAHPRIDWNKVSPGKDSSLITASQSPTLSSPNQSFEYGQKMASQVATEPRAYSPKPVIIQAPTLQAPQTVTITAPSLSPKVSPKAPLSSDWTTPPTAIQPPRFVYPGKSPTIQAPPAVTIKSPNITLDNKENISPKYTVNNNSYSVSNKSDSVSRTEASKSDFLNKFKSVEHHHVAPPSAINQTLVLDTSVNSKNDLNHTTGISLSTSPSPTTSFSPTSSYPTETLTEVVERENGGLGFSIAGGRGATPFKGNDNEIIINKAGGPLGLSIVGGSDHSSQPFGADQPGIFVSKIVKDGAACKTNLKIGDRILAVNGKDVTRATHQEAVMELIAPTHQIKLQVRHDPPPQGLHELVVIKLPGEKLGMSIKGGLKNYPANPSDRNDEGIFISRINDDGAVARDKRLSVGQRILEVNGQSLLGASHQEAVRALRSVGEKMSIMVCEGYDPSQSNSELSSPGSPVGFFASSRQGSVSSIDREDQDTAAIRKEVEMLHESAEWETEDSITMEKLRREREEVIKRFPADFSDETTATTQQLQLEHAQIKGPESPDKSTVIEQVPALPKSKPPVPAKRGAKPPVPPKTSGIPHVDSPEEPTDPRLQSKHPAGKHLLQKKETIEQV